MQEDEGTTNEGEAALNEDDGEGGAFPSENQQSDKTADVQEGQPSSLPCPFIHVFI